MSVMFVCAMEEEQGPERTHETAVAMVRCSRCGKHAVGGYWCQEEGCEHQDVDPADKLTGHGEGKCEPVEVTA
jgi:hypothetical protein